MKIKFLRSVLVRGVHCERGSVADLDVRVAGDLINAGDASIAVDAPKVERAEIVPKAEHAFIPKKKQSKKKR